MEVEPVASSEYELAATRPAYSVLDSSRAAAVLGLSLPHWLTQLELVVSELRARA